ncbi:MAG: hypothetical protein OJF49_004802 [Ktedonobacterales bacterium]|nr:MAG: hypothetical protein OJF49_004802 [Ktedonobacterales bacterium]
MKHRPHRPQVGQTFLSATMRNSATTRNRRHRQLKCLATLATPLASGLHMAFMLGTRFTTQPTLFAQSATPATPATATHVKLRRKRRKLLRHLQSCPVIHPHTTAKIGHIGHYPSAKSAESATHLRGEKGEIYALHIRPHRPLLIMCATRDCGENGENSPSISTRFLPFAPTQTQESATSAIPAIPAIHGRDRYHKKTSPPHALRADSSLGGKMFQRLGIRRRTHLIGGPVGQLLRLVGSGICRPLCLLGGRIRRLLSLVSGAARCLARLAHRRIGRSLRLADTAIQCLPARFNSVRNTRRQVVHSLLRLALPLIQPLLQLRSCHLAPLRSKQQTQHRANRGTPYESTNRLHRVAILLDLSMHNIFSQTNAGEPYVSRRILSEQSSCQRNLSPHALRAATSDATVAVSFRTTLRGKRRF